MHYKSWQACVTNWGSFVLLQIREKVVTNWGSFIITNQGKCHYKLGQLLQIRAIVITKQGSYYKLTRQDKRISFSVLYVLYQKIWERCASLQSIKLLILLRANDKLVYRKNKAVFTNSQLTLIAYNLFSDQQTFIVKCYIHYSSRFFTSHFQNVLINQFVSPTFCLCFVFAEINFRDMLHHVCDVAVPYDENLCGPIRTCKCRSINRFISANS